MREHDLQSQVEMLGELQYGEVRDQLLAQADIFLNTSLTEAFCMAIVEAVSCGLTVVSTKVGGIPEVLPEKFINFVDPDFESIEAGIENAVFDVINGKRPTKTECHNFVRSKYDWLDIAQRTEVVYERIENEPKDPLEKKLYHLWESGRFAGPMLAILYLFLHFWIEYLDMNP